MPRCWLIVVLSGCLCIAGCGPSASERLVGKWKYDVAEAAKDKIQDSDVPHAVGKPLLGIMETIGARLEMEIEFKADGTMTISAGGDQKLEVVSRTWEVVEAEGDQVTLRLGKPGDPNSMNRQVTFVDDDHFEFAPPGLGGKTLLFARTKEE